MTSDAFHDDELLQEMLADFLAESDELLSSLNENVLELDTWARTLSDGQQARCDDRLLNEMFRDAHTLKGLSGMLGLNDINDLTHKVENLFDAARHDQLTLTPNVVELVFRSLDLLTQQIEHLTDAPETPVDPQKVLAEIESILQANCQPTTSTRLSDDSLTTAQHASAQMPDAVQPVAPAASFNPFEELQDEVDIHAKYLAIFIDEAGAALDEVTETLADPSPASTGALLIQCHKVKGSAAAIGLHRAAHLAHAMEDALQECINDDRELPSSMSEAMLRTADILRTYIDGLSNGESQTDRFYETYQSLQNASNSQHGLIRGTTPAAPSLDDGDLHATTPQSPRQVETVRPVEAHDLSERAPQISFNKPQSQGASDQPLVNQRTQTRSAANAPPTSTGNPTPDTKGKPTETLRVDIERLDQLMNLAGELVINKARFSQIEAALKGVSASRHTAGAMVNVMTLFDRIASEVECNMPASGGGRGIELFRTHAHQLRTDLEHVQEEMNRFARAGTWITDLADTVHQLARVTDEIQKTVMDTRMVPIGPLFRRFKRVIRDIAHGTEKEIQLVIRGENTELDKRMIDELGDPLIHMVRNCADHGIETPAVRTENGKPRQGTVTLDAFHRGNSILVTITDDGKGLDPERIRNKAIEKGIVSGADAEKMTRQQLYQLIWEPGLSTAEQVTEVSGRGMGMDIVRARIEDLNGSIEFG